MKNGDSGYRCQRYWNELFHKLICWRCEGDYLLFLIAVPGMRRFADAENQEFLRTINASEDVKNAVFKSIRL